MTILVAAGFDADEWRDWWPLLQTALPGERLVRERVAGDAAEIDIALVANPPFGALRELPGLKLIQSLWAGVDRLLSDASVPIGVPVARMVDPAMNQSMAETALWAVLGLQRRFFAYATQQRAGEWKQHALQRAEETSIAVLGLGQMGRAVVQLLEHHGYRVDGWSTRDGEAALPRLLSSAGIVINLMPLTPATQGFFNAATFARMRSGAALVNLARGGHVVDADLLAALESGQVAHAVLDAFHTEPLPPSHTFWSHPRVTVLPHVAAPTDPRSAALIAAANVEALRAGRPLAHLVDRARGY